MFVIVFLIDRVNNDDGVTLRLRKVESQVTNAVLVPSKKREWEWRRRRRKQDRI